MSYVGRIQIRARKEGEEIEILSLLVLPRKGWQGDLIIDNYTDDAVIVEEIMSQCCDGVHQITATYHESYVQDYWGEWDGDFWFEKERVKYIGQLLKEAA